MIPKKKKNCCATLKPKWKIIVYLLKQRTMHHLILGQKYLHWTKANKGHFEPCSWHNLPPTTWVWNGTRWSYWWLYIFWNWILWSSCPPYAHIQLKKSNKLILSHFQEEDHPLIYDNLDNKKIQLVCLFISYRPKKHISRTDITNDDQNDYAFAPIYVTV